MIIFNLGCVRTNDLDSIAAYTDFLQRAIADRSANNDRNRLSGLVSQNPQCLEEARCSHRQHIRVRGALLAVLSGPGLFDNCSFCDNACSKLSIDSRKLHSAASAFMSPCTRSTIYLRYTVNHQDIFKCHCARGTNTIGLKSSVFAIHKSKRSDAPWLLRLYSLYTFRLLLSVVGTIRPVLYPRYTYRVLMPLYSLSEATETRAKPVSKCRL